MLMGMSKMRQAKKEKKDIILREKVGRGGVGGGWGWGWGGVVNRQRGVKGKETQACLMVRVRDRERVRGRVRQHMRE